MSKILIVDDEAQIRRILSVMLADSGFEVASAESGEQALEVCKEVHPEIVLIDVNLPGMDGHATLRAILEQHEDIDCIMMTAYVTIRSSFESMNI